MIKKISFSILGILLAYVSMAIAIEVNSNIHSWELRASLGFPLFFLSGVVGFFGLVGGVVIIVDQWIGK